MTKQLTMNALISNVSTTEGKNGLFYKITCQDLEDMKQWQMNCFDEEEGKKLRIGNKYNLVFSQNGNYNNIVKVSKIGQEPPINTMLEKASSTNTNSASAAPVPNYMPTDEKIWKTACINNAVRLVAAGISNSEQNVIGVEMAGEAIAQSVRKIAELLHEAGKDFVGQ